MRRDWKERIAKFYEPFDGTYFVIKLLLILGKKKVKPSHFHDVIERRNICFMLEWKSYTD